MYSNFIFKLAVAALGLTVSNVYASSVSKYTGKRFGIDQARECFQEAQKVQNRLMSTSDFLVLEGSCARHGLKLRVEFSYLASTEGRIKLHTYYTNSKQECSSVVENLESVFTGLPVSYIDAYCDSEQLNLTYFDTDYYLVKSFRPKTFARDFVFNNAAECSGYLSGLSEKLKSKDMPMMMSYCSSFRVGLGSEQKIMYRANFTYLSAFNKNLQFFTGASCERSESECSLQQDESELKERLKASGHDFVDSFYALEHGSYKLKQQVVFVSTIKSMRIKEFKGSLYYGLDLCQEQLEKAVVGLQTRQSNNVIYSFCHKSMLNNEDVYSPFIYYSDTLLEFL